MLFKYGQIEAEAYEWTHINKQNGKPISYNRNNKIMKAMKRAFFFATILTWNFSIIIIESKVVTFHFYLQFLVDAASHLNFLAMQDGEMTNEQKLDEIQKIKNAHAEDEGWSFISFGFWRVIDAWLIYSFIIWTLLNHQSLINHVNMAVCA